MINSQIKMNKSKIMKKMVKITQIKIDIKNKEVFNNQIFKTK